MVGNLKDKFKNFWIEDRKIKLKAREDLSYETFERRTLIIENLPVGYKQMDVVKMISEYGSVVSIEMPTKNLAI